MVTGNSPEPLPPGWSEHVKYVNGRKIKYYTNKESGIKVYSRKEVFRRTSNTDNIVTPEPISKDEEGTTNRGAALIVPESKTSPESEWLPQGWKIEVRVRKSGSQMGSTYKLYIEPSTGRRFYSKLEVIRHLESEKTSKDVTEEKQNTVTSVSSAEQTFLRSKSRKRESSLLKTTKNSVGNDAHKITHSDTMEGDLLDGLPPGWIKETKIRKYAYGTKSDPYYIDPLSGYMFRSKKDALRYLETGDIGSCSIKPQKKDMSDVRLTKNSLSSPPSYLKDPGCSKIQENFDGKEDCDTSSLLSTEAGSPGKKQCNYAFTDATDKIMSVIRELFDGEESKGNEDSDTGSLATTEVGSSKKKQYSNMSTDATDSIMAVVSLEGKHKNEPATISGSHESANEISKRDVMVAEENGFVSKSEANISHEKKSPENGNEKNGAINTPAKSNKLSKRKLNLPGRSSKRLAGHEPELQLNLDLEKRSLRETARSCKGTSTKAASSLPLRAEDNGVTQQHTTKFAAESSDCVPGKEEPFTAVEDNTKNDMFLPVTDLAQKTKEACTETGVKENCARPPNNQAVPDVQAGKQISELEADENSRPDNSQFCYPFGDSWSDPCLEFAFKTLTGVIPVEDTLACQGCLRQEPDIPYTQVNGCLGLPGLDGTSFFQDDLMSKSDSLQKQVPMDQLPTSSTFLPSGSTSIPGCSSGSFQQPNMEPRNEECHTKARTLK